MFAPCLVLIVLGEQGTSEQHSELHEESLPVAVGSTAGKKKKDRSPSIREVQTTFADGRRLHDESNRSQSVFRLAASIMGRGSCGGFRLPSRLRGALPSEKERGTASPPKAVPRFPFQSLRLTSFRSFAGCPMGFASAVAVTAGSDTRESLAMLHWSTVTSALMLPCAVATSSGFSRGGQGASPARCCTPSRRSLVEGAAVLNVSTWIPCSGRLGDDRDWCVLDGARAARNRRTVVALRSKPLRRSATKAVFSWKNAFCP